MDSDYNDKDGGHGLITVEYTVFCCQCMKWEYLYAENKAHAIDNARAKGWTFNRKTKQWSCPDHNSRLHKDSQ